MDDIDGRIVKKTCRDYDCVIITPEKLYDFANEADDDLADLQCFFSKIQKRMNLKPMIRGDYTNAKNGGFVGLPLSVGYDYGRRRRLSSCLRLRSRPSVSHQRTFVRARGHRASL